MRYAFYFVTTMKYAFILLSCLTIVSGHGSVRDPPARNVLANSNYCPDCLNAGGVSVMYNGLRSKARYGVCGDPWNAKKDHEAGGKFARGKIARTYKSGSTIGIKLSFSANHMGRMSFSICDLPDRHMSKSLERSLTTQRCFNKNVLRRADGKGVHSFLNGNEEKLTVKYKLPRGLKCKHCVLQWNWETGNSCCPANTSKQYCEFGVSKCFRYTVPEQWFNCADIKIV
jgi:hypothetical protein